MKELKVGERITVTLEVVKQSGCRGCFFETPGCIAPYKFKCGRTSRSDNQNVIFKEVKE
ncbi:hypothetical protein [Segatella copri]|uniref:hypothetical protein n=1 Tax=Segatella copri TaxID=165179 RepID=UPI0022DEF189|nr:hypothetical protein [Segatella copri]